MIYIKPEIDLQSFTCSNCKTITQHDWVHTKWSLSGCYTRYESREKISVSTCLHCGAKTLWANGKKLLPDIGSAPIPNSDMSDDVKEIYLEAASISSKSPRGAAALLRLGIQVLCKELGGKGENINDDIASLVKKGLPVEIQQALDAVRVIGNEAVHPGTINTDDEEVVIILFNLVNIIVDDMITRKKKIAEAHSMIPASKLEAIKKEMGKLKKEIIVREFKRSILINWRPLFTYFRVLIFILRTSIFQNRYFYLRGAY